MDDADLDFLSKGERSFFVALNNLGVRFMVVGMSAALLQGARGATDDIDLWFEDIADERIGEAARLVGGFFITRSQPPMFGGAIGDRIDIVFAMSGITAFAPEYECSLEEAVSGVKLRLLPLKRILDSKIAAGRSKDGPGIAQIELLLAVLQKL